MLHSPHADIFAMAVVMSRAAAPPPCPRRPRSLSAAGSGGVAMGRGEEGVAAGGGCRHPPVSLYASTTRPPKLDATLIWCCGIVFRESFVTAAAGCLISNILI